MALLPFGSPPTPDATSSIKGKLELTNDLGGSATAPTVVATHLASALPLVQGGTGADLSAIAKGGLISGTGAAAVGITTVGGDGTVLSADSGSAGGIKWIAAGGVGTVTTVSVVTANGVSGSVANATTTPAITLTLGAITPTTVNGNTITTGTGTLTIAANKTLTANNNITISGTDGEALVLTKGLTVTTNAGTIAFSGASKTLTIPLDASVSGTNTGDQTITLTGNVTGSGTGSFATTIASSVALSGSPTTTTQTPADNSTKIATTAYVDNAVLGQRQKEAVKYASTAALPSIVYANGSSGVGATLTGVALAAISLDSSSPSVNDRVLIKNQVSTFQNGIYTVTATGSGIAVFVLTRTTDFDQASDIQTGDAVFVTAGTTLANTTWAYNGIDSPTMGTDAITFVQAAGPGSYTAGNGIAITGVSIAIDTSVTVDKTTAQTLTNKTLDNTNSVTLQDTNFTLQDNGDNTKQVVFQLSGITTGTTKTMTLPNSNGTLINSNNTLAALASTTSAQLAGVISDETGTNKLVFSDSPTLVTPALGTPASGVATNLTGTAASLTAGTVTTNANLTGDVTSSGNATTLAAGSASNLNSGTLAAARMPALTGDVTTSAGAVATTFIATAGKLGGAWAAYTPTLTNITTGNGTKTGRWMQAGKTVLYYVGFLWGSTSSQSGVASFSLPATSINYTAYSTTIGNGSALHSGSQGLMVASWTTTTTAELDTWNVASTYPTGVGVSQTAPWTWASGDSWFIMGMFEVA